jgi:UDP-N-acetylglucosamine acyltransferase
MHKLLYRDGLTLEQAANRIRDLSADKPEVQQDVDLMVQFLSDTPAQRGIVR